jgi:hypothetical protein
MVTPKGWEIAEYDGKSLTKKGESPVEETIAYETARLDEESLQAWRDELLVILRVFNPNVLKDFARNCCWPAVSMMLWSADSAATKG